MTTLADVIPPGAPVSSAGGMALVPDLATLVRLPWHPAHALAAADLMEPAPDGPAPPCLPFDLCPRAALRRAVAAASAAGLAVHVGFETEFRLAPKPGAAVRGGRGPGNYCHTLALDDAAEGGLGWEG